MFRTKLSRWHGLATLIRIPTVLIMIGLASPANAAEWWFLTSFDNNSNLTLDFADKESATRTSTNVVQGWTYVIHKRLDSSGVRKTKSLYKYDCDNRTMTPVSYLNFGNNGVIVSSGTFQSYEQRPTPISPDSIGETEMKFF